MSRFSILGLTILSEKFLKFKNMLSMKRGIYFNEFSINKSSIRNPIN